MYALYVSFFPQLIAGPIIRHNEIIHQYKLPPKRDGLYKRLAQGSTLFIFGLCKKVFIADGLAETATPIFNKATYGSIISFQEGWVAALTYSGQIYFDFSGYSDMAIGLGLLFGFNIPINFNAPYIAKSVREFWGRWHITLSTFLRDYLYIPLGGNRHGIFRQLVALQITMLLGGLWHGAGWTFVIWGGLHGLALGINHLWQQNGFKLPSVAAWFLTMLFLVFTWVVFRAESFTAALSIVHAMTDFSSILPDIDMDIDEALVIAAILLSLFGPTSHKAALEKIKPKPIIALMLSLLFIKILLEVGDNGYTEFIYFQF
jgi:D-alanyl-lipoteichoic acid acyltransferase DltB (MBOAT superfamily)